jgi:arylsulfatase A-like enzyme
VDCLRSDYVGCLGGKQITPNIDAFFENSMKFTNAFSNGPGTNQSFPSIMTSTYFLMNDGVKLNSKFTTLAEMFSESGYYTVGFHSNPFLSSSFGWSKGFDEYYDNLNDNQGPSAIITKLTQSQKFYSKLLRSLANKAGISTNERLQKFVKNIYYQINGFPLPYLDASALNKQVISWLKEFRGDKLFLWMHYMDPHYPYVPPDEYLLGFKTRDDAFRFNIGADYVSPNKEETEIFRSLYTSEVRYTDSCIGLFLDYLKGNGFVDDAIVILTADHGHAFMEHGRFGHSYDILYNEVLKVPLLVRGVKGSISSKPVSLIDLAPTLADVCGFIRPKTFKGTNVFDEEEKILFAQSASPDLINLEYDKNKSFVSCMLYPYKLIYDVMKDSYELYDIGSDPCEQNNIVFNKKILFSEMKKILQNHIKETLF